MAKRSYPKNQQFFSIPGENKQVGVSHINITTASDYVVFDSGEVTDAYGLSLGPTNLSGENFYITPADGGSGLPRIVNVDGAADSNIVLFTVHKGAGTF